MLTIYPGHQTWSTIHDIIMKPNPWEMKIWSMKLKKKKITNKNSKLKKIKVKFEIKNKLKGNIKFSFWVLNWKEQKH
jgi:hypothetical protein